jgi:creatinine amidohydrolase
MKFKSHWWWDLTTRDFAELDMSQIVAVLPVAAVEQHGPHLPVRVDSAINAGIIARAVEMMGADFPALILPMTPVGKSNEHLAFPGTLTLSYETLARVWYELCESAHRAGVRKVLLFNSHGGQPQVIDIVCRELRVKLNMFAVSTMWSRITRLDDLFSAQERRHGIHGGECETSVMLHLHPELIEMERAKNFVPLSVELERANGMLTPEGAVGFGWQTQDLNRDGACGNAAAADAERGSIIVQRAAEGLVALIDEIARYPMDRITNVTAYRRG